ncbi:type III pantothenate kinase [Rubrivirga sp.]|uniref:type III pantothenate kinase n=1 Tax=Rubrivirga sp. TaxID=1885344 RepID=UPI003B51D8FD
MSFLALDAGNSSVKAAVWDEAWSGLVRFPADDAPAAVWAERLADVARGAEAGGLASVVPALTPVLAEAVEAVTEAPALVVSTALALPFRLAYETPATLGADRLAAAVGAWALAEGRPVIALDAGTAITTEVVSAEPAYLGGAILPGPDLLRRALARDTRQLPDVPWPDVLAPIGTSTVGAIQAGLGALVLGGVAGLVRRTQDALGGGALVVATGGWGSWLAERLPEIDRVEPFLVLDGVRRLARGSRP